MSAASDQGLRGNGNKEWMSAASDQGLRGNGNKEKIRKQGWLLVIALVFCASKTRPKHI